MADPARYRYMDTTGRRSPPLYNPARSSMPVTGGGYSSLYGGDLHAMSASHHEGLSRPPEEYRTSAVPVSANTYAVRKEPLSRSTSVNDGSRAHRIVDHNAKRPIIVTTKHQPPGPRSGSPSRDPYRSSDEGQYYAEPASSIPRSRATGHVPSSTAMDEEEYRRLKDRTHHDRLGNRGADPYRSGRTGPLYAGPNHRANTFDYEDEGYEYTKPSDLARYDLDHDQRRRPRRESLDRYYRPTVSISTDLARPFDPPDRRTRGPPPTTRGLEKLGWSTAGGIYDGAGSRMPLPPAAPLAPDVRRPGLLETPGSPREEHRGGPRPLSMIQDDPGRLGHHPEYYYEDALPHRDARDRDHEFFHDDRVRTRGFGILVDPNDVEEPRRPAEKVYRDERRERREPQKRYEVREPRRRSDDDLEIIRHEYDDRDHDREHRRHRDHDYVFEEEAGRDRRDRRSDDDEPDSKKDKIRDKVAAGLGLAAASVGLSSAVRGKDDRDNEDRSSSRRHRDEDTDYRRNEELDSRARTSRKEPLLGDEEFEIVEHPTRDRERVVVEVEAPEPKKNGDPEARSPRDHSSSTDEGKTKVRRRPRASSFNPNDTAALAEMKARLAEIKNKDTARETEQAAVDDKGRSSGKEASRVEDPSPERKPPAVEKRNSDPDASALVPKDDGKGRDLAPSSRDERQVRVVPPPKDAVVEKKPIKGILKQPKAQFPEEQNPVREGVAPHKDDKTKADVPQGARWTKISRKMVNPEALKIGKERFEVRDDFVIVLRVLSKEEIQAYAAATATLRERRKKEYEREMRGGDADYDEDRDRDRDRDREPEDDDDKKRRHRQHRRDKEEDDRDRRDRDRHRRRQGSDDEDGDDGYETRRHAGHHRSHRNRGVFLLSVGWV
ncbi:hypothetical protein NEMBOFW57_001801 [Staphylotrichum longicolle]|uniref:DUF8035 domain-containing protein n=1 Tax=Staphylotrichum longicolle TaxID=669026 RepID=A0AAD4I1Z6_9PEZI|nr:hypothetical protein NEMBOFW57_001801 [Staphylotrichum longicolle]